MFFGRHPTLKRVCLRSDYGMDALPSVHISLANLEYYEGDAAFISAIDTIGLKKIEIFWSQSARENVDKVIAGIGSITKSNLPFVSSHTYYDDPCEIVTSLSKHMRHTQTLRLRSFTEYSAELSQDTVRRITECLPQFTGLMYLAVRWDDSEDSFPTLPFAANKNAVERWGEVCPTLQACCLTGRRSTVDECNILSTDFGRLLGFQNLTYDFFTDPRA
ncbi:hypothetical protein MSAN_02119000 [Mycena sanguinolenta]|uniref:Uncharacterized protein n=1 Tax=Mycena sanguinolenta TaxID=230812 RepID=A0A8H6XID1_9AGAR|nr:hypothetical protein MSAN_02119000 [Mycena sanguinolenta]